MYGGGQVPYDLGFTIALDFGRYYIHAYWMAHLYLSLE